MAASIGVRLPRRPLPIMPSERQTLKAPASHYRVLICDDLELIRRTLQFFLGMNPEFQVVAEAANGREAIAKAIQWQPDLVVMDAQLPDLEGAEATRQILAGAPRTIVLAYSSDSAWESAERMLEAGARGYVAKGMDPHELVRAVRTVLAGGHYLSLVLLEPTC
jgi:DNA-binding NarL/FixJ family response regulator